MKAQQRSSLGIALTESGGEPLWELVGAGALARLHSDKITTAEPEALPLDRHEVNARVEHVMAQLEAYCSHHMSTPGGAEWLYVQHVPVRRLVTRLVRKLMALSTWTPFAQSPGHLSLAPYEGLIGIRDSSSREYRSYTVTWSGVAYALGARAPYNPVRRQPVLAAPVEGLQVSLAGAEEKLTQLDRRPASRNVVDLGIPTSTSPGSVPKQPRSEESD
ncbi:hypothetical protein OG453_41445 [Streptomyces sp. NBC_01381]|uniref:hypothetical protein n=1 Tax=Streptomyces sp. NBC_01381 TaxID=2903845 RepID=UPI00225A5300|nr:hypothetical protein [Streptomyces sp. NBC_01381]MCX4673029.1 hypothetical protein [Streptomyces sp. NBC_01381]